MSLRKKLNIKSNEKIIKIIYPTSFKFFKYYFISSILLLIASFCSFWLITRNNFGIAVFIALILIALYFLFKAWYKTRNNFWVLTTSRIFDICRYSFLNEEVSIIHSHDVGSTSVKRIGIASKIFRFGDLHIAAKEGNFTIVLSGIKTPDKILDLISDISIQNNAKRTKHTNNNNTTLKDFFKILPLLNLDELEEVYEKTEDRLADFE